MPGNGKEEEVILGTESLAEKMLGSQPGRELTNLIALRISERRRVKSGTSSGDDSPLNRSEDYLGAVSYLEKKLPLFLSRRLRAQNPQVYGQEENPEGVDYIEEQVETDEDADLVKAWLERIE